jgi:peptidyl-prolyl cis-trans isomerase D
MRSAGKYIWIVLFIAFVGGYLLLDTSGLLGGGGALTLGTSVGSVNGHDITYGAWQARTDELAQQREQQGGRAVDMDERAQIEDQAFEDLVMEVLYAEEFQRRKIHVTDQDIIDAARFSPPPSLMQSPEMQTDGRFDRAKWERFLASPAIRQQGGLAQLEAYYRQTLPKEKFYAQLANDVYAPDAQLWRLYQDSHDTVVASYVAFRPAPGADSAARSQVTDAEISAYYEMFKKRLATPSRAIVTAIVIPRRPVASDSADTRARVNALRARLAKGEKFEDVAKEASDDSASAVNGGQLPPFTRGMFNNPQFDSAAFRLKPGQIGEPALSPAGWHIIKVDSVKGDTLMARHIMIRVRQSDSTATRTDRRADSLAKITGGAENSARFDSAARTLGIIPIKLEVMEGQRALGPDGMVLPGLAQWGSASGARVGEVSDLFDSEDAYFLAKIDSLMPGGQPSLDRVRDDIRMILARRKAVQALMPEATEFAKSAASVSLEQAAAIKSYKIETTPPATRVSFVPNLGPASPVIGAAFGLSTGAVSEPVVADDGLYVVRTDRKSLASKDEWQKQLPVQRLQMEQQMQQDRFRQYIAALREEANVVDRRKEVMAAARRQTQ